MPLSGSRKGSRTESSERGLLCSVAVFRVYMGRRWCRVPARKSNGGNETRSVWAPRARHVTLQGKYIEMRRSKRRNTKKKSISITRKNRETNVYGLKPFANGSFN